MIKIYLATALILASFGSGWMTHSMYQDSKDLAATKKAVIQAINKSRDDEAVKRIVETKLVKSQQETKVIFKTITKEVTKYVTKNVVVQRECLDDTGLLLWNAANAGADTAITPSGRNITAMPRFSPFDDWNDWRGYAAKSYRRDGGLLRLSQSAQFFGKAPSGD